MVEQGVNTSVTGVAKHEASLQTVNTSKAFMEIEPPMPPNVEGMSPVAVAEGVIGGLVLSVLLLGLVRGLLRHPQWSHWTAQSAILRRVQCVRWQWALRRARLQTPAHRQQFAQQVMTLASQWPLQVSVRQLWSRWAYGPVSEAPSLAQLTEALPNVCLPSTVTGVTGIAGGEDE